MNEPATCSCKFCAHNADGPCECNPCLWILGQWDETQLRDAGHVFKGATG